MTKIKLFCLTPKTCYLLEIKNKMNTITYENVKPILEAVKQMGRVVLLGVIPVMLAGINTSTGSIVINWSIVMATALALTLTSVLVGLDKGIHLEGKVEDNDNLTKGITQF